MSDSSQTTVTPPPPPEEDVTQEAGAPTGHSEPGGSSGFEDFTTQEAGAPTRGLGTPVTEPYDPEPKREWARAIIALTLIGLLIAIVMASFVTLWVHPDYLEQMRGLLELIFAPIIALVGSATGFYFGGKTKT